jgi:hypothetical protein
MSRPRTPSAVAVALHWVARIWSLVPVLLVLTILISDFGEPTPVPVTTEEIALLAIFPVGASVGLIVAWWYPLVGSLTARARRARVDAAAGGADR